MPHSLPTIYLNAETVRGSAIFVADIRHSMPVTANPQAPSTASRATGGQRLSSVQGLRAVAVLLVVWTHAIDAADYFSSSRQSGFFHLKGFGACGLDIFFVISGFIVSLVAQRAVKSEASGDNFAAAGKFLTRRFTRIFPLYWILTAVIILEAELGTHHIVWHRVTWLPTVLLLPSPGYPIHHLILSLGWSLLFEIYFYLVLAGVLAFAPRKLVRNAAFFLGGMVLLGLIVGIHRPLLVLWANPVILEFLFGCILAQVYLRAGSHGRGKALLGRSVAAAGTIGLAATIFTGYGRASEAQAVLAGVDCWLRVAVWGVPAALLVGGSVLWAPAMRSWGGRLLVFLGDASYSIYLCTNPVRSSVEHFGRYFGRWGGDAAVAICAVLCVGAGVLCYLVLERPLMRLFRNWYKPIPFRVAG